MASMGNLPAVCAMALALLMSALYKDPAWLGVVLQRHPALAALGVHKDANELKFEERTRREFFILDHSCRTKHRLAWEVIRGQRTLLETAACFQQLHEKLPARLRKSNSPDLAGLCEQVLQLVIVQGPDGDNPEVLEAICRLECELNEVKSQPGKFELPQLPPAAYAEIRGDSPLLY